MLICIRFKISPILHFNNILSWTKGFGRGWLILKNLEKSESSSFVTLWTWGLGGGGTGGYTFFKVFLHEFFFFLNFWETVVDFPSSLLLDSSPGRRIILCFLLRIFVSLVSDSRWEVFSASDIASLASK